MKRFRIWVSLACLAAIAGTATATTAADIKAGKQKAMQCAVCHGPNGIAVNPDAPNLAGEASIYIEKQLKAFRSGARQNEMMTLMAKDLSDADIADLAVWFAAMKISVTLPEVK